MDLNSYFLSSNSETLIGEGWVYHGRPADAEKSLPKNHFKYAIFNLLVPLHQIGSLESLNRFSFLSINSTDYLDGKTGDLFANAKEFIEENMGFVPEKVWLQTLPRIFGYSFNPISFWFCYSSHCLEGVLCEVNNTFGDRHFYYIKFKGEQPEAAHCLPKRFHVSPFFPISGTYTFEFVKTETVSDIKIKLTDKEKLKLDTRLLLNLDLLSKTTPWRLVMTYKWLTVAVIVRIHLQALKLWLKGIKFYKRPQPPREKITL
jgi:DUF1365 family protein